jgi:hypothetical protein
MPVPFAAAIRVNEEPVSAAIEMKGSWPWPSWMRLVR